MGILSLMHQWESEWLHYHKVTFDGTQKLIIINDETNLIDVQNDVYSSWVEWVALRENSKFLNAMRFTGGDATVNGQSTGLVFFMINGWRIFFNQSVNFIGSIFSDNYPSPFIVPQGTFIGQSVVSSLVTQAVDGGGGNGIAPTADQIATAVWNRLNTLNTLAGSTGELIKQIDAKVDDTQALIFSK